MRNFTKQNFKTNPLWVRLLIMALMLLLGTGSAWAVNKIQGNCDIYFDNSKTQWTDACIQFVIGHNSYSRTYVMTKQPDSNLYHVKLGTDNTNKWDDATYYAFIGTSSKWGDGGWGPNNITNAPHRTTTYTGTYDLNSGSSYYFVPTSSGDANKNGASFEIGTSYTQTYTVKKSESGTTGGTVQLGTTTLSTSDTSMDAGTYDLTITAPTGYNVSSVTVSGGSLTTAGTTGSNTYSGTVNVTAATTISVTYICSPSTSIISAILGDDGKINLKGNFNTCIRQYHGFQWRIKGNDWCQENIPNDNSGYVSIYTNVNGEDTGIFEPKQGKTYEFRTYIYGNTWVYSSETIEVSTCVSVVEPAVTMSPANGAVCQGSPITLTLTTRQAGVVYKIGEEEIFKSTTTYSFEPTTNSVTVTASSTNACAGTNDKTKTFSINIKSLPEAPTFTSNSMTVCAGEPFTLPKPTNLQEDTEDCIWSVGGKTTTGSQPGISQKTVYTAVKNDGCPSPSVEFTVNVTPIPTITGATYTQPGKSNAITLTAANGILADWSVDNGGDLSKPSKSNTTEFSAEGNGTYIITADNKGCTDTHVVTVSDAFYVYMRQPKKGETAYNNFYYPTQNPTQGGDLFYKEYSSIPPAEGYTDYNQGGRAHDVILTDCDGYVWYGFKASAQLIDGTNYFTVHAPNKNGYDGWFTHTDITKPGKMTGDIYYIMGTEGNGNSGWKIEEASAPYSGPVVHALGSTTLGADKFAALYVTDCSGKEIDAYQWEYCRTQDGTYQPYSSVCSYTFEKKDVVKTENSDAGQTNNIRPSEIGYYRCKVTYKDGNTATSATEHILGSYSRSFTSTIPVLVVNTGSKDFPSCPVANETASKHADKMKKKLSVDVKIYDGTTLVYDRKARMAYRGSSSLNFLKKSYAFCPGDANCGDAKKGADYVKTAKLNMLGIGDAADKDWVLYAAAADPSMLRNRMVFETYQAMRPGEWGVKSRYVELIINGEYKGVYLMMDKITQNKKRVNVEWDVKDETKRGFILKFDKTDVADRSKDYPDGDEKTFLSKYSGKHDISTYDATNDQAFEIEYPEKEDIEDDGGNWYDVINFIQGMINNFETALSAGEYQKVQQIIDYESWADWFILSEYTKNVDAFRASCVFVYDGTKLKATPLWDQELSFNNQSVYANRTPSDPNNKGCENVTGLLIKNDRVYSDSFAAPFWFTGKLAGGKGTEKLAAKTFTGALLNDPCFVQMVKNRWEAHKTGALSNASLTALITNYEKELTSAVRTREANFWIGKSRNTLSCSWNSNTTGYYDDTYADAKADITAWISDAAASGSTGRRAGLSTAIDALKGTGLDIAIKPASIQTTPWVPVVIQVQNETGYEYTLTYTDGELDKQPNIIIEKSGDTYKYHIPRPWPAGNELEEGERTDISYGIKATLQVGEGNNQCGSKEELPSATATIVLQDEPNEICQ